VSIHRTGIAGESSTPASGNGAQEICGSADAAVITGRGDRPTKVLWAPAPDAETAVIVQFHGPALAGLGRNRSRADVSARMRSHKRQRAELRGALAPGRRVRRSFSQVLNGAALEVDRAELARVRALPAVRAVFEDREVTALLVDSRPSIRADLVESALGSTGAGRVIAIVDTGVDYTHPDLGAGIGPGFKVIGGRDFVNDDDDPFDDNGHGTHVAGIAAANGSVRGVAPGAKLLAVKVLNEHGSGRESDVLAGIEYAIDPDGDPLTRDGADVINLSLGASGGHPGDLLALAADSAVAAGVVVVAAAGNAGEYFTIESPGASRNAITVGASDHAETLAEFSSRGPSSLVFGIKPDVLAPGVEIVSTVPTGECTYCDASGRRSLSGTSMATPHVAGAAALLLELEPEWPPERVKTALLNYAVGIGEDVYSQGAGLVDVFAAADGDAAASAPSLGLRVDDGSGSTFMAIRTVEIANRSDETATFDLSIEGFSQAGIEAHVSPLALTLAPGELAQARVELSVDNALVPDAAAEPFHYEGGLLVGSSTPGLRVPIAFIKSPLLSLEFDEAPWFAVVHDRKQAGRVLTPHAGAIRHPFPANTYDIHVAFRPTATALREVLREDVAVAGTTALEIRSSEANHRLEASLPVDPGRYRRNESMHVLNHKDSGFGFATIRFSNSPPELLFSDVSPHYELQWQTRAVAPGHPGYSALFSLPDGVSTNVAFAPSVQEFAELRFDLAAAADRGTTFVLDRICGWPDRGTLLCAGAFSGNDPPAAWASVESEFLMPTSRGLGLGYLMKEPWSYLGAPFQLGENGEVPLVSGGMVRATGVDTGVQLHAQLGHPDPREPQLTIRADEPIPLGYGPVHWAGRFANSPDMIRTGAREWLGHTSLYDTQIGDIRWTAATRFELLHAGDVIEAGVLAGELPVTPGRYTLRVALDDYPIAGGRGSAVTEASFDTRLADPDPPFLRSLQVLADGAPATRLHRKDSNELVLGVEDGVCLASVAAWLGNDPGRRPLRITREGDRYRAELPAFGTRRRVTLRVLAADCSGNELQLDLLPGFLQQRPGRGPEKQ
jgi:subtilisin family serine protease